MLGLRGITDWGSGVLLLGDGLYQNGLMIQMALSL